MFNTILKLKEVDKSQYLNQFVTNLPGEHVGVVAAIVIDFVLDFVVGRFGLGAADDARTDAARLLVAVQDLGDAAVRNAQLAGNNAGTDAGRGQFDDLQSNVVGQRSAVDEHAAQLIDTTLAYQIGIGRTKNHQHVDHRTRKRRQV